MVFDEMTDEMMMMRRRLHSVTVSFYLFLFSPFLFFPFSLFPANSVSRILALSSHSVRPCVIKRDIRIRTDYCRLLSTLNGCCWAVDSGECREKGQLAHFCSEAAALLLKLRRNRNFAGSSPTTASAFLLGQLLLLSLTFHLILKEKPLSHFTQIHISNFQLQSLPIPILQCLTGLDWL